MKNFLLKSLPPQSTKLYGFLRGKKAMTAKDISIQLDIYPHAVYRAIKPLKELGIVNELATYPTTFEARETTDAINMFSTTIRKNFLDVFTKPSTKHHTELLDISFVNSRDDLIEKTNADIKTAKNTVNFLVSGLEVPAETVVVFKQAVERGVEVRALIQRLNETTEEMFKNWKKMGVHVRYYPNMEARIFVIDGHIVYFTSYNPNKKEEANGVRFNYVPYAKLMIEVFEQRWATAQDI